MILCITPNTALDRTLVVPNFSAGAVYRVQRVVLLAGGKGLNVARALKIFGTQTICAGFIAGQSGQLFADLAVQDGLEGVWTRVDGETRTCVSIADPNSGETTVLNEQGSPVTADDWDHLQRDVLELAAKPQYVCITGSLPRDSLLENYIDLIRVLQSKGHKVWVDTSGAALRAAITALPTGIKINHLEAAEVLESDIPDVQAAAHAARTIQSMGIESVIITMGKAGAVFADKTGIYHAVSPQIEAVSTVGSGDVFCAGLLNALSRGAVHAEALRQAVTAGAANTLTIGAGYFEMSDFERLLQQTSIVRLA